MAANLRILKHLNPAYTISCPIFRCEFSTKNEEEAYLHHTIAHEKISTKHMLACIFCSEPLLGKALEEHVKERNSNGPQDTYHDMSCCGLTITTIGEYLAHQMATHTIQFMSKLSEETRVRMSKAMYNNASCVAWAKTVPIMVMDTEVNMKVPDLFDQEFADLLFLMNAQTILENITAKYNNAKLAYRALNRYEDHTAREMRKINHELVEEGIITSLKEMYEVFNMGHRLEIYCNKNVAEELIGISNSFNIEAKIIGAYKLSFMFSTSFPGFSK
jgi:hypothetical protein